MYAYADKQNLRDNTFEIQSNIDGYTQSDMWEGDSQGGYLENSRRMLYRLKRGGETPVCKFINFLILSNSPSK